MKKHLAIFLLPAMLAATGCTPHPPGPPSKEEKLRQFVRCFREEMEPTDEQVRQLQGKVFSDDADARKMGDGLGKATEELERRLEDPAVGDAELREHYQKVAVLRARLSEDHFNRMLLLRSMLTDAQKRKFLACKRKLGPPSLPQD